ncbi:MAG: bifunctional UDP-3-O-[3-hydroxymyristoyl] N-acetylglucosamine deacetylase/3-hydroxyacyl-ACP dehydratase [Elusimicrobiota bacterium]
MSRQRTIKNEISYSGIGLHTGNKTTMIFKPAEANAGIVFVRADLPGKPIIKANLKNVTGVIRGTNIGKGEVSIQTVEHLMAAFCGLGIDNIIVELDANEPPVGDGSCADFITVLRKAEIVEQNAERQYLVFDRAVEYSNKDVHIIVLPCDEFMITCTIDYNHPVLNTQYFSSVMNESVFMDMIAPSRTFCFDYEIETLKKQGLAKGGNLTNAIVIGDTSIHNKESLRFENEFVRHKVLDLIGDLYLVGHPIKGHVIAIRCGHAANIEFAKKLIKEAKIEKPQKDQALHKAVVLKEPKGRILDINDIKNTIPHRYPFLFIDKVVIVEEEKKAVGYKNLTANEDFFNGHFPERPIMPGVIIVEAMAQTSCVLFLSRPEIRNKLAFFMGINDVKFRKPVVPGDQIRMDVELIRARARGGKVIGKAYVDSALVAEAEFMFSLVDK